MGEYTWTPRGRSTTVVTPQQPVLPITRGSPASCDRGRSDSRAEPRWIETMSLDERATAARRELLERASEDLGGPGYEGLERKPVHDRPKLAQCAPTGQDSRSSADRTFDERKAQAGLERARGEHHEERGRLQAIVATEQERVRWLEQAARTDGEGEALLREEATCWDEKRQRRKTPPVVVVKRYAQVCI